MHALELQASELNGQLGLLLNVVKHIGRVWLGVTYPLEVEALKACISEKLLDAEGWSVDSSGMILNQRGRKIFPAGFVSAIQKVLKQL